MSNIFSGSLLYFEIHVQVKTIPGRDRKPTLVVTTSSPPTKVSVSVVLRKSQSLPEKSCEPGSMKSGRAPKPKIVLRMRLPDCRKGGGRVGNWVLSVLVPKRLEAGIF